MRILAILIFSILVNAAIAQPIFKFTKYDEKNQQSIKNEIYKYHIKPDIEQQKVALKEMLQNDKIEIFYLFDFIKKFPNSIDSIQFDELKKKYELDFDLKDFGPLEEFDEWYYKFLCLDFDGDKKVDVYLIPAGFFGPSLGLVCFARVKGKLDLMFYKAGYIVKFEKRSDKIVLQYEILIIEDSETNVLETLVFDLKTNDLGYDSKLYYANDTKLPKAIKNKGAFELKNQAALRTDKKNDDKAYPEDWFNTPGRGSNKLRGNVVADFPAGSEGYILGEEGAYVFVAFKPDAKFIDCSLRHGMESPHNFDQYDPIPKPCYICGWLKKDQIKKSK